MKRLISLVLVLVMVTSFVVALAEETPVEKTPKVIYSYQIGGDNGTRVGILEVMGYEDKQPLMFQDSPENPKTGFCRLTREEIDLLPDEHWIIKGINNSEVPWERDSLLRKAMLEFETLYDYTTKKDGTMLRAEKNSKVVMYYPNRLDNMLQLNVKPIEIPIFFEHMAACMIDDLIQKVKVDRIKGSTFEMLDAIYWSIAENTLPSGNHEIPRDVAGWVKKSKKQIESDKEYVTQLLLSVTKEEFNKCYWKLWEIFVSFTYKFDDGHSAFIILNK